MYNLWAESMQQRLHKQLLLQTIFEVYQYKQLQELPGYNFFTLKYYDDGYLVDEDGEQIDDPDRVVGSDYMNHFGEYEEDEVCIRNDVLESDFMIIHMCVNYIDTI